MAESTLSYGHTDLMKEVAYYLGYSRDSADWSSDETSLLGDIVNQGTQQAYYPPAHVAGPHEWSFLRPTTTITAWPTSTSTLNGGPSKDNGTTTVTVDDAIFYDSMVGKSLAVTDGSSYTITSVTSTTVCVVSGDASGEANGATVTITANGDYRLPDDFGGIEGDLTYAAADDQLHTVPVIGEGQIRTMRQSDPSTNAPLYAAVKPLTTDGSDGQRFDLMVVPTPDDTYTLGYRYNVLPDALTSGNPSPYGGMPFGQVLMASCLAVAELRDKDQSGPYMADFEKKLAGCIEFDRRANTPDTLGYNSDESDIEPSASLTRAWNIKVTVGGVQY